MGIPQGRIPIISNYYDPNYYVVLTGNYNNKSYQPKGADYEAIQRLVTRCDQLEKSKTQENNRLEASANKQASHSIKRLQKAIDNEIVRVRKNIADIVKNNQNLRQQVDLLTSINGIGERTAWSILAYIGDINFFSNSKQLASYAGLTPKITQSGTSIYKSSLSKLGRINDCVNRFISQLLSLFGTTQY